MTVSFDHLAYDKHQSHLERFVQADSANHQDGSSFQDRKAADMVEVASTPRIYAALTLFFAGVPSSSMRFEKTAVKAVSISDSLSVITSPPALSPKSKLYFF